MYDDVAASALAYREAVQRAQGLDDTRALEALIRARVAMADALTLAGWVPSSDLAARIRQDRALLRD